MPTTTPKRISVELTPEELRLILEALDSHEYWQLSDESERSNGSVILPEDREDADLEGGEDDDDTDNHAEIRACRRLEAKLAALVEP